MLPFLEKLSCIKKELRSRHQIVYPATVKPFAKFLDGRRVLNEIKKEVAAEVFRLKVAAEVFGLKAVPGFGVILVGDRKDSVTHVRNKKIACHSVGINTYEVVLAENCTEEDILKPILELNSSELIHGILVQLPLPSNILKAIRPEKDVGGFHPLNISRLASMTEEPLFAPCTPKGCIELLRRYNIPIKDKIAVVIGRSRFVGKPAALLLEREGATVTTVHSGTKNPEEITRQADIIISAVGKPDIVKGCWVKPGAVLIDVGMSEVEVKDPKGHKRDEFVGDICYKEASKVASAITPVPGGVGPMTIAMLLSNTLLSAKRINNIGPSKSRSPS